MDPSAATGGYLGTERSLLPSDEEPDFARGERTEPKPDEEPDYARGERETDA